MNLKIAPSFWSDEDIGELTPEQRLAFLWCLTNGETNQIGFLKPSKRKFLFDTGLGQDLGKAWEVLVSLTQALPKSFVVDNSSGQLCLWIRNFIKHQWPGSTPFSHRNIGKCLRGCIDQLPAPFHDEFNKTYPRLYKTWQEDAEKSSLPNSYPRVRKANNITSHNITVPSSLEEEGGVGGGTMLEHPSRKEWEAAAAMEGLPTDLIDREWHKQERKPASKKWKDIGNLRHHAATVLSYARQDGYFKNKPAETGAGSVKGKDL